MANAEETVVRIPVVIVPIEIELAPVIVVPQFRDVPVQVDLGDRLFRILAHPCHHPLIALGIV